MKGPRAPSAGFGCSSRPHNRAVAQGRGCGGPGTDKFQRERALSPGARAGSKGGNSLDTNTPSPDTTTPSLADSAGIDDVDVWKTKPAWCQPWTILLTGLLGVSGSWGVFHSPWFTGFVGLLVSAWWTVFLVLYPQAYKDAYKQGLVQRAREFE